VLVTTPEIRRLSPGDWRQRACVRRGVGAGLGRPGKDQGRGCWGPLKPGCWLRSSQANFTWPSGKRSAGIVSGLLQLQVFM